MSLFSNLNVGTRGLMSSQLGMDITGQNITNADVEGYSRKRLNQAADYRYDSKYGQMGFGVEVINIERMRDIHIDEQIRKQNVELGAFGEIDKSLESIENIFTEPSDTGIMGFIDKFFDSWENLANNPADESARTMVKTNGEILADSFHNVSDELRDLRSSRNAEIESRVARINELTSEIFSLNKEIAAVEVNNQSANDSRDNRDKLLKKLSKIIDITTVENSLGQVTVSTAGNIIVSPVNKQDVETTTSTYTRSDGTTFYDYGLRFASSKREYVPTGGEIYGLLQSRDTIIPAYETYLNDLATGITENVNELHKAGYNLNGYSGINFFDPTATGASDINISASVASDIKNIAASAAQSSLSATTNATVAGALDFGNIYQLTNDGVVSSGPADTDNSKNIVQGTVVVTTGAVVLQEGIDYSVNYINGTIQMLHSGYNGNAMTIDFDYRTGGFSGPGDNTNAVAIADLRNQLTMSPNALGNETSTFNEYYSSFIGRLGLQKNEAASNLSTREDLIKEYEDHQDSIAGVSLDEEMAQLIKYQHTYQSSARIISTANQMLDVLMNI